MNNRYAPPSPAHSKAKLKAKLKYQRGRLPLLDSAYLDMGFDCAHCRRTISIDPTLSGVRNRNHCPYCLWSRHVDLNEAGDRLAACKAEMRPVGLTLKRTRKKYARENQGELMLVHQCTECGKWSINRIAADDNTEAMLEVFLASLELDPALKARLTGEGIRVLEAADAQVVRRRLLGVLPGLRGE